MKIAFSSLTNRFTKSLVLCLGISLFSVNSFSQSVGIGTTTPNSKSVLDLTSTNQGVLVPRVTDAGMASISASTAADNGMLVFNTTQNQFMYYSFPTGAWEPISGAGSDNDWVENADTIYNNTHYVVVGQQQAIDYIRMLVVNNGTRTALAGSSNGDGTEAIGVEGYATGSQINIGTIGIGESQAAGDTAVGVFGEAIGGGVNYAGIFGEGNVFIENNLGVGTGNPSEKLHIYGTDPQTSVRIEGSSNNLGPELHLASTAAGGHEWRIGSGQAANSSGLGKFYIYNVANGQDYMVIDTAGNLGIKTTNPKSSFQIGETVHLENALGGQYLLMGNNLTYDGSDFVRSVAGNGQMLYMGDEEFQVGLYGNGAAGSGTSFDDTARFNLSWGGANIEIKNLNSFDHALSLYSANGLGLLLNAYDSLGFNRSSVLTFDNGNGYYAGIKSSTNMTNSFDLKLPIDLPTANGEVLASDVNGNLYWSATTGADTDWTINGSDMFNANSGNVGVGINTPLAPLEVFGPTNSPIIDSINNGTTSLGAQRLQFSTGDVIDFGFQQSPAYAGWMQAGFGGAAEPILINPLGGNVGVNNNNPNYTLDVTGNINYTSTLLVNGGAGLSGQVLTSSGGGVNTWTSLPAADGNGIYAGSGSLIGGTSVTQGANTLDFTASSVDAFSVDGTTFSVDAANNRVGIGTAAPSRPLEISGSLGAVRLTGGSGTGMEFVATAGFEDWQIANWNGTLRIINSNDDFATTGTDQYVISSTEIRPWVSGSKDLGSGSGYWSDLFLSDRIYLNGSSGTAGQVLTSNGVSDAYWSTPAAADGNGIYGGSGSLTSTTGISYGANNLAFNQGNGITYVNLTAGGGDWVFQTGGAARSRFENDGDVNLSYTLYTDYINRRVGIGTTAPSTVTDIQGYNTTGQLRLSNTSSAAWNTVDGYTRFRMDNAGSTDYWLFSSHNKVGVETNANANFNLYTNTYGNILTATGEGNVGIGTTTPSEKLHVVGNIVTTGTEGDFYATTSNGVINCGGGVMTTLINYIGDSYIAPTIAVGDEDLYIADDLELGATGNGYKPGGGSWVATSDRRLKKDIKPYTDGLSQILNVKPVYFKYNEKSKYAANDREFVGIIAQDMLNIAPYMVEEVDMWQVVVEDENGKEHVEKEGEKYYTFDPSAFTYMSINAIQEQQAQIETLKTENAELKSELEKIKKHLGIE